jgi:hypothetical protein
MIKVASLFSQPKSLSLNPQVAKSSLFQEALWGFFRGLLLVKAQFPPSRQQKGRSSIPGMPCGQKYPAGMGLPPRKNPGAYVLKMLLWHHFLMWCRRSSSQ